MIDSKKKSGSRYRAGLTAGLTAGLLLGVRYHC
jgi:hypothetical protein